MASIKDSIDEAFAEKLSFIKYPLLAVPICASYELFKQGNMDLFYFVLGVTLLIVLTVLVKAIYNTSNNQSHLLPTFNIIDFIFAMAKVSVSVLPVLAILGFLGHWLTGLELPLDFPNIHLIYSIVVWSILGSVGLTSVMNYARTENIKDAYNVVIIFKHSMDVLIAVIFLLPQLALFNAIFVGILVYLFWIFYNIDNLAFAFICSVIIAFNIAILGNYFSQMGYEIITRKDLDVEEHNIT